MKTTKAELKAMIKEALREELASKKPLKEARSSADIQAEIERLQQELAQAKAAEKKATYGGNLPKQVWSWDMYIDPSEKGTWCSAVKHRGEWDGNVFETEDDAVDGAWTLLSELEDEGELDGDPDDYTIDTFSIPISDVSDYLLSFSNLDHLI